MGRDSSTRGQADGSGLISFEIAIPWQRLGQWGAFCLRCIQRKSDLETHWLVLEIGNVGNEKRATAGAAARLFNCLAGL